MVGVSADRPKTQQKFIDKFGLTFPMLADTSKQIIAAYGAMKLLGVTAERKTFLVDPKGHIARVWKKVKVDGHAADVIATIRELAVSND